MGLARAYCAYQVISTVNRLEDCTFLNSRTVSALDQQQPQIHERYHTPGPNEETRYSLFTPRLITTISDTPGGYRPSMVEYFGLVLPACERIST